MTGYDMWMYEFLAETVLVTLAVGLALGAGYAWWNWRQNLRRPNDADRKEGWLR